MLPVCCPVCNVGVLWPNGWKDQDTTWYWARPRPRRHSDDIVLDGDPVPPRKGAQQPPPTFRPMSIVAKRLPISATAELKFKVNAQIHLIMPISFLDNFFSPDDTYFHSLQLFNFTTCHTLIGQVLLSSLNKWEGNKEELRRAVHLQASGNYYVVIMR